MITSDKILKIIYENKDTIKKFGVKHIGLFGSYAINKQKKQSDIDVLVEFKKGKKTFDNYMDLKFYLENLFDCNVDLVIKEALKVDVKPNILKSVKYAAGL
ncbi:MAG: nucleotidyltransferase family protein [Thermoplasmatota archaeon]